MSLLLPVSTCRRITECWPDVAFLIEDGAIYIVRTGSRNLTAITCRQILFRAPNRNNLPPAANPTAAMAASRAGSHAEPVPSGLDTKSPPPATGSQSREHFVPLAPDRAEVLRTGRCTAHPWAARCVTPESFPSKACRQRAGQLQTGTRDPVPGSPQFPCLLCNVSGNISRTHDHHYGRLLLPRSHRNSSHHLCRATSCARPAAG